MKKVVRILLLGFVFLGLTGCTTPTQPSPPKGPTTDESTSAVGTNGTRTPEPQRDRSEEIKALIQDIATERSSFERWMTTKAPDDIEMTTVNRIRARLENLESTANTLAAASPTSRISEDLSTINSGLDGVRRTIEDLRESVASTAATRRTRTIVNHAEIDSLKTAYQAWLREAPDDLDIELLTKVQRGIMDLDSDPSRYAEVRALFDRLKASTR